MLGIEGDEEIARKLAVVALGCIQLNTIVDRLLSGMSQSIGTPSLSWWELVNSKLPLFSTIRFSFPNILDH